MVKCHYLLNIEIFGLLEDMQETSCRSDLQPGISDSDENYILFKIWILEEKKVMFFNFDNDFHGIVNICEKQKKSARFDFDEEYNL